MMEPTREGWAYWMCTVSSLGSNWRMPRGEEEAGQSRTRVMLEEPNRSIVDVNGKANSRRVRLRLLSVNQRPSVSEENEVRG